MLCSLHKEEKKSIISGLTVTLVLALLIYIGSRNLAHFDAALVGYTFASLFASFAITYRYTMWLQRPPTKMYWKRGLSLLFSYAFFHHFFFLLKRFLTIILGNSFIWKRSKARGLAHWLIMWGCLLAAAITFPLAFGWIYFIVPNGDFASYQIVLFGWETFNFQIETTLGHLIFHGLVIASCLVISGVFLALKRRLEDKDALALQSFNEDFLPLLLLLAISVTGIFLTVSYTFLKGYGYEFLSIFHAITVIFTLIHLPFGKFFHIFMRPAQFGVQLYKLKGLENLKKCVRCNTAFASVMHVQDLITVQKQLGYHYEINEHLHYQEICPQCRRKLLGISQGSLWQQESKTTHL